MRDPSRYRPPPPQPKLWTLASEFFADTAQGISTGFPALDALLPNGGIPVSRLTELIGVPTSGMTTLAYKWVASAQGEADLAAYLDLSATLDPDYARRCGVRLERLVIVRPADMAQALEIARDLFKLNTFRLVVLDCAWLADRDRQDIALTETALRRWNESLIKSKSAALLLRSPAWGSSWERWEAYIEVRLAIQWAGWLYSGEDVSGYQARVELLKDKRRPSQAITQTLIDIRFDGDLPTVQGDAT